MEHDSVEVRLGNAVNLLKALSNKRRLVILCALCKGEKCVSELEDIVGLSQSALSQHLARLRRDGFVKTRRDAQTIYYSNSSDAICKLLTTLNEIFPGGVCCDYDAAQLSPEE